MNQALKYEELEKIFFTKAPITDTSIWLLKLDPDCQNNPVEKALLDANFKDGMRLQLLTVLIPTKFMKPNHMARTGSRSGKSRRFMI